MDILFKLSTKVHMKQVKRKYYPLIIFLCVIVLFGVSSIALFLIGYETISQYATVLMHFLSTIFFLMLKEIGTPFKQAHWTYKVIWFSGFLLNMILFASGVLNLFVY